MNGMAWTEVEWMASDWIGLDWLGWMDVYVFYAPLRQSYLLFRC